MECSSDCCSVCRIEQPRYNPNKALTFSLQCLSGLDFAAWKLCNFHPFEQKCQKKTAFVLVCIKKFHKETPLKARLALSSTLLTLSFHGGQEEPTLSLSNSPLSPPLLSLLHSLRQLSPQLRLALQRLSLQQGLRWRFRVGYCLQRPLHFAHQPKPTSEFTSSLPRG